jgi:hypothetical protein
MIFCPVRKRLVKATPEELVRCQLLSKMLQELGYPLSLLSVERKLHEFLPQMAKNRIPNRRLDILCYSKNLEPLLLIECKKDALPKKAISQLLGYNYYIQARFIAAISRNRAYVFAAQGGCETGCVYEELPPFEDLLYK